MLKVLKDEGNLKNLLTNKKIVVLYFTANWCMPCKKMYEPLEDLSIKYKDILDIIKIDIDEFMDTAENHNVIKLPTFAYYLHGKLVEKTSGANINNFNNYLNNLL